MKNERCEFNPDTMQLPCAVGDKVHYIYKGKIHRSRVVDFHFSADGLKINFGLGFKPADQLGEIFFLDRESADLALGV